MSWVGGLVVWGLGSWVFVPVSSCDLGTGRLELGILNICFHKIRRKLRFRRWRGSHFALADLGQMREQICADIGSHLLNFGGIIHETNKDKHHESIMIMPKHSGPNLSFISCGLLFWSKIRSYVNVSNQNL